VVGFSALSPRSLHYSKGVSALPSTTQGAVQTHEVITSNCQEKHVAAAMQTAKDVAAAATTVQAEMDREQLVSIQEFTFCPCSSKEVNIMHYSAVHGFS